MADEIKSDVQANEAPKQMDPAEKSARLAALAPANVPDKFKNEDGTVNVASLTEAYRQLETKQSQPKAEAQAQKAEPEVNLDEAFKAPAPSTDTWQAAQAELADTGKLSPTTREALKKNHNANDQMIDSMVAGYTAGRQTIARQLADAVGGAENLTKTIQWAKGNLTPAELAALRPALEGPHGSFVAAGLKARMDAKEGIVPQAQRPAEPKSIMDITPMADNTQITPFVSRAEYLAAFKDRRYNVDPVYTKIVAQRAAMTR